MPARDSVSGPKTEDWNSVQRGIFANMNAKQKHLEKVDAQERANDFRDAILSADVTGMIAGEELITNSETILPTLPPKNAPPHKHR